MTALKPSWIRIEVEPTDRMREIQAQMIALTHEYERLRKRQEQKAWRDIEETFDNRYGAELDGKRKPGFKKPTTERLDSGYFD